MFRDVTAPCAHWWGYGGAVSFNALFGLIYFAFMIVFFAESKRLFACRSRGIGKCKKRERYKLLNRGELISFSLIVGRGVIRSHSLNGRLTRLLNLNAFRTLLNVQCIMGSPFCQFLFSHSLFA